VGYGNEGKDDTGAVYRFTLGEKDSIPPTVAVALDGMREGGRRRVLVPPSLGWRDSKSMSPRPDTFGAYRRLEAHKNEPLLFEAELRRVIPQGSVSTLVLMNETPPPFARSLAYFSHFTTQEA
jgi:hypothetical protein